MTITITVADVEGGKVDIHCDTPAPAIEERSEMSRLVAWFMLYAAEKILINTPVRTVKVG